MSFEVKDLTEEELKSYNSEKESIRKDCDSEEEFLKAWENPKGWFNERSVLNRIKNERCFSRDEDGLSTYTFIEDERPTLKSVKLPESGKGIFKEPFLTKTKKGAMVSVRPCNEKYGNKTYIGFYLGELPLSTGFRIDNEKKEMQVFMSGHNPAIFVPELQEIIFGMESWWGEIRSEEDFKRITDEDIQNVWYVKLMNQMAKKEAVEKPKEEDT